MNKSKNLVLGNSMLFVCAFIWGMALIAQRWASGTLKPFAVNSMRYFLASAVIIVTYIANELIAKGAHRSTVGWNKTTIIGGILCGICIFFGNNLQQIGVSMTSIGKTSFITVLYIVIVPFIQLLARKKPSTKEIIGVGTALIGFMLMSVSDGFHFQIGDVVVLVGSLMIAFQIYFIGKNVEKCDPVKLTLVQFLTAAIISVPAMAIEGFPSVASINASILPILYVGILSAGIAFTLQTIGQKHTDTTTASLIMSIESVVGMVAGVLFFKEVYSVREFVGCMIVLVAVFVAQFQFKSEALLKYNKSKFFVE